jgi:hypothetical protein
MQRHNNTFTPSPYPSPQGEGTSGKPAASGLGIEKHNKIFGSKKPGNAILLLIPVGKSRFNT